jgi:glycosyltransferase involved in cell wall biosynthesis
MSNNITVIIPIHKIEENYFNGCIQSIKNQRVKPDQVLIVRSDDKELVKFLDSYDFRPGIIISNHKLITVSNNVRQNILHL